MAPKADAAHQRRMLESVLHLIGDSQEDSACSTSRATRTASMSSPESPTAAISCAKPGIGWTQEIWRAARPEGFLELSEVTRQYLICRRQLALVLPPRPDRHRRVRLRRLHAGAAAALRPLGRADPHAIAGGRRRHLARSPHRRRPASTVHLQGSDVCLCRSGHRRRRHADVALAHAANHRLAQFRAGAGDLRHGRDGDLRRDRRAGRDHRRR